MAELQVIRYLVLKEKVFGEIKGTKGLELHVSNGRIKKLVQRRNGYSESRLLARHAVFLDACFPAATIIVEKDRELHIPGQQIEINAELSPSIIEKTMLGDTIFTRHAQVRLSERHDAIGMGLPKNPYKLLVQLANNPKLTQVELDGKIQFHKRRKYGNDKTEIWKSADNPYYLTIVRTEEGAAHVVTVFTRLSRFDRSEQNDDDWRDNLFQVAN